MCKSKNTKKYKEALSEHDKVFTMKEKRRFERLADVVPKKRTGIKTIRQ